MSINNDIPEDIKEFWRQQSVWSQQTFGSDIERGPLGPAKHLVKEANEVPDAVERKNKDDILMELTDCLFLTFDTARRAGFTFEQLLASAWAKLDINKKRKWQKPVDDKPIEHVRTDVEEIVKQYGDRLNVLQD